VRNPTVEAIFTTADDAMQGLWGLHMYVNAAVRKCDRPVMLTMLPEQQFPVTHEWQRNYDREELVSEMDSVFEFVHCRNSVVALVAIFEAAVSRFNSTLSTLGHAPARDKYKHLLVWICELLETTKVGGSAAMLVRLRQTCGDLDHARRLRNCITHNNGSYEQFYFDDTIKNGWVTPQHMKDAVRGVAAKEKIFIVNAVFENLLRSHIEVLHILHNTIQRTFFGHTDDYNYAVEQKPIEWHRILSGRGVVGM
jgi:hypothetical protein